MNQRLDDKSTQHTPSARSVGIVDGLLVESIVTCCHQILQGDAW